MHQLQHLMSSLLDQGHGVYPYAPNVAGLSSSAAFGILHAPVFSALQPGTFSHLQVEAILEAPGGASVSADAMFRQHAASHPVERNAVARLESLAARKELTWEEPITCPAEGGQPLEGTLHLSVIHLGGRFWRVQARLANETPLARGTGVIGPSEAAAHAFHSAHVLLQAAGGRFHSPLARDGRIGALVLACRNENTVPVIASPDDTILLGAALIPAEKRRRSALEHWFDRAELDETLHG